MKIYAVTSGDYSVNQIFLSKDKANHYVELYNKTVESYDEAQVEEWKTADDIDFSLIKEYRIDGLVTKKGELTNVERSNKLIFSTSALKNGSHVGDVKWVDGVWVSVIGYNKDRVEHAFRDRVAAVQSRYLPGGPA